MLFWLSLGLTILVLLGASELGYRIGRAASTDSAEQQKNPVGVVVASLLALLGLLLGFSFSMVDSRFAARKALVLEDANAIGTTYLRASLLPPPHDERVADLLREYIEYRVVQYTPETVGKAMRRSEELHRELWQEAEAIAELAPRSQVTNLFITSLNEMIDLHASRMNVGLYQRLPGPIRWTLYAAAAIAIGVLGYVAGMARKRALIATTALVVAVSLVMTIIVDLNRPGRAVLQVDFQAFRDVQQQMRASPAPVTAR